jgi:hypothetical protein
VDVEHDRGLGQNGFVEFLLITVEQQVLRGRHQVLGRDLELGREQAAVADSPGGAWVGVEEIEHRRRHQRRLASVISSFAGQRPFCALASYARHSCVSETGS